jgi:DNA-binding FadR family transcriptional regulator
MSAKSRTNIVSIAMAPDTRPAPRAGIARSIIRIPKTAEVVASYIRKMIIRGEVREGDFLQPEAQLIDHFGTSRPTIREAFRILENEQLISVTRGSRRGARVHSPRVDSVARYAGFALQAEGTLLSDIYLARLGLEPFAARLVAQRRTPAQLAALNAELDEVFDLLGARGARAEFRMAVVKLHQSIVEAAGSNTLTMISAMLQGVVEQHMANYVSRPPTTESGNPVRSARGGLMSFRKLLVLIEAKDAEGAEAHWREHMQNANATWLLGYDQTALVDVLD